MSHRSESDSIESVENGNEEAFVNIVESGQIGYRLADEIRTLREALLTTKQEKRILLINNENLEDAIEKANKNVSALRSKLADLQHLTQVYSADLTKKDQDLDHWEETAKQLKKQLTAERKKNKLLSVELERSLEDEVALRSYSKRLEADNVSLKEKLSASDEAHKAELEERWKCQQFIDTALRSQLILQKKLETIVYYCDKDVDMSAVSILDVSPDYLESLLRDVRSEVAGAGVSGFASSAAAGFRGKFDFAVLDHKQHNIDHQGNQYLNNIRSHVSKLRKSNSKTRKYMRSLLDVIHTYEELPSLAAPAQPAGADEVSLEGHHQPTSAAWGAALSSSQEHQRGSRAGGVSRGRSASASMRDSHSHSHNNSGRSSREASPHPLLNRKDGDQGEDYSHARTLAMLEQIQASLRRDRHMRDEP